ncbi:hypothetical protein PGT21_000561 [Puccinia graminis f. sp. tritici]|uniref:Uncharacterized protein n=1 Tax=Puccinia graminis f. sp. tritici TaxID=56615 RepID=A0A5B0NVL4_PUCGR|nr:hypothetical protein PGT21_000561 [Puccinia graminis f. sp. tritici]
MVALMEPDNLEGDESTERTSVTNCSYARQIEEAQNAISQRSMERNIPYYAVPDALVIWNICRMHLESMAGKPNTSADYNGALSTIKAIDTQAPWIMS